MGRRGTISDRCWVLDDRLCFTRPIDPFDFGPRSSRRKVEDLHVQQFGTDEGLKMEGSYRFTICVEVYLHFSRCPFTYRPTGRFLMVCWMLPHLQSSLLVLHSVTTRFLQDGNCELASSQQQRIA